MRSIQAMKTRRESAMLTTGWRVASHLRELAAAMRSYRDLPAAPHEPRALADQKSRDAFAAFVGAEESVLAFLEKDTAGHRAMLLALNDG